MVKPRDLSCSSFFSLITISQPILSCCNANVIWLIANLLFNISIAVCITKMLIPKWSPLLQFLVVIYRQLPYETWFIWKCKLHSKKIWEQNATERNRVGTMTSYFLYTSVSYKFCTTAHTVTCLKLLLHWDNLLVQRIELCRCSCSSYIRQIPTYIHMAMIFMIAGSSGPCFRRGLKVSWQSSCDKYHYLLILF